MMINYDELAQKYQKLGIEIPTKKMIKTPEQIEKIRQAGIINTAVLDEVAKKIKAGMSTQDIDDIVSSKTKELGGICAPLNYEGYPKSVCTSINDQVCHGIPDKNVILKDGDIINVDCTTILDGYYADASRMFMIGKVDETARYLVKVTKECLDLAVQELKPFSRLRDIGFVIERHAKKNGFSVVHEVGGHGVGIEFHEDPFIFHYGQKNTGMVLFPGMVFTIEPMINEGSRAVFLDASNNWTIYTDDGGWSSQYEYTVLITEEGVEILSH
ncbi:MAG: type I methionyl aminopeptidase [Anaeroplasmataceae bacterium]|nr:type I methionyl aminopeptidase [Anaeroplasmataceae bacterium]